MTFRQLAEKFWALQSDSWRPNTRLVRRALLDRFLLPLFGHMQVTDLKPVLVLDALKELDTTVNYRLQCARLLSLIMRHAVYLDVVEYNLMHDLVRMLPKPPERHFPSAPHGFRAMGRTYLSEIGAPFEISEAALGHADPSNLARIYARTDYLEQRRPYMQKWSDVVQSHFEKVYQLSDFRELATL